MEFRKFSHILNRKSISVLYTWVPFNEYEIDFNS